MVLSVAYRNTQPKYYVSLSLNAIHLQKIIAVEDQAFTQNRLSTISLDINKNIILAKAYLNASQRSQLSII